MNELHSTYAYDLLGRMLTATTENFTAGTLVSRVKAAYDYDTTGIRSHAFEYTDTVLDLNTENWTLNTETQFLVDHQNHTGYQQVLRETHFTDGVKTKTVDYSFGHDELTQTTRDFDAAGTVTSDVTLVFGHDGHGSVRILTDMAAAISQMFLYDAYGQMLAIFNGAGVLQSGGNGSYADASLAATILLYSGEQFDSRIGQQYLRARYYDATTGTFNRLDPFFGNLHDPQSFHKYLYTHADPVNGMDPTGMSLLGTAMSTLGGVSFHVTSYVVVYAPAIAKATTIAMAVSLTATLWMIAEELQFVPDTNYPEWILTISTFVWTAGLSMQAVASQMRGRMIPFKGTRRGGQVITGKEANSRVVNGSNRHGYEQDPAPGYSSTPPYKSKSLAVEGVISKDTHLVRFFKPNADGSAPAPGRWVVPRSEVAGLTKPQIADKLALPGDVTHYSEIKVDGNTWGRLGTVAAQPSAGGGLGGALQMEIPSRNYTQSTPIAIPAGTF